MSQTNERAFGPIDPALFQKGLAKEYNASWFQLEKEQEELTRDAAIKRIEEKCDTIIRKLDLIFGDHVLINCRLVSLKDLKVTKSRFGRNEGQK
jgi:hypothetical protein